MRGEGKVPLSVCHTVPLRFAYSFFARRHKNQGTKLRCAEDIVRCRSKKQMPKGSKQPQVVSDTPGIGTWPRPRPPQPPSRARVGACSPAAKWQQHKLHKQKAKRRPL